MEALFYALHEGSLAAHPAASPLGTHACYRLWAQPKHNARCMQTFEFPQRELTPRVLRGHGRFDGLLRTAPNSPSALQNHDARQTSVLRTRSSGLNRGRTPSDTGLLMNQSQTAPGWVRLQDSHGKSRSTYAIRKKLCTEKLGGLKGSLDHTQLSSRAWYNCCDGRQTRQGSAYARTATACY